MYRRGLWHKNAISTVVTGYLSKIATVVVNPHAKCISEKPLLKVEKGHAYIAAIKLPDPRS